MIQERDLRIDAQKKWATYVLVALNTFVFFASNIMSQSALSMNDALIDLGAISPAHVWKGEIWRFITAIFLHQSFIHFALNTFVLLQVGRLLEPLVGGFRLIFLFVATGAVGFALSLVTNCEVAVGASGAVFGLIGAMLGAMLNLPRAKVDPKLFRSLIFFVVINLLLSVLANTFLLEGVRIDNASHLGGLLCGVMFGFVFVTETDFFESCAQEFKNRRQKMATFTLVLGLAACFGLVVFAIKPIFLTQYHEIMALDSLMTKDTQAATMHAQWLEESEGSRVSSLLINSRLAAQRGDHEKATKLAEQALQGWGGDLRSFWSHAVSSALFAEPKGSLIFCELAIKKGLNDVGVLNDCAWLVLTTSDPRVRDSLKGFEWAFKAVNLQKEVPAALYHTLAEAYLQSGKAQEAIHAIDRGLVKGEKETEQELLRLRRRAQEKLALRVENGSQKGQ
jgi:membrane associated rhomboid family serine protease